MEEFEGARYERVGQIEKLLAEGVLDGRITARAATAMRVNGRIRPFPEPLSDLAQPKPKYERLWSDLTGAFPKH
jgi:hypothetical protein